VTAIRAITRLQDADDFSGVPADGDALLWDEATGKFVPGAGGGSQPTGAAGGDLGGTYPDPDVVKAQGIPLDAGPPSDGDGWVYDAGSGGMVFTPIPALAQSGQEPVALGAAASVGSLAVAARADHVHPGAIVFPSNIWISPFGQNNGFVTPVVGTYYCAPFRVPCACTLVGIGILIKTSPSNDAVLKLGLHANDDATFLPSTRILATSDITGSPIPTNTMKAVTGLSVSLTPGLYWAGYIFTAGTTLTNTIQVNNALMPRNFAAPWVRIGTVPSNWTINNDGSIATQADLSDVPTPFAGAWAFNSNAPNNTPAMAMLFTVP
jgi:hypothetical protein